MKREGETVRGIQRDRDLAICQTGTETMITGL